MGVKDNANSIARLPVVACLHVFQDCDHRLADHLGIVVVVALTRDVSKQVSSVTAKNCGDADEALTCKSSASRKFRYTHANNDLVADRLILIDSPRRSIE